MNSNSIVERAIHVCLEDFQDTVAPARVNMYPLVNFDSSESAIQLASLYPSSTGGYCPYLKAYSLVCDTYPNTRSRAVQYLSLGLLVYLLAYSVSNIGSSAIHQIH